MNHSFRIRVGSLFLAASVALAAADGPRKKPIAAPADGVCGQLSEYGGLHVLELWGDAEQTGYAQGRLLGLQIVQLFDEFVVAPPTIGDPSAWDRGVLPKMRALFEWPEDSLREIQAMHRGMTDAVGADGLLSKRLGRALIVDDLLAVNAFADLHAFMCSTFSAWGDWTEDGETVTGRNLDFPSTPEMERAQLVVIRHGHGDTPAWAGVTWPGAVGVYTAMSSRGVTILMHDAPGLDPAVRSGFTPRALILREALEAARPETYVDDIERVFRDRRVLVGNNIHVSISRAAAKEQPPAVVFEYDGGSLTGGVTRRVAPAGSSALWCTNRMCARREPTECWRFEALRTYFAEPAAPRSQLSASRAFELLHEVRQDTTLHSVYLKPASREMTVRIRAIAGDAQVQFKLPEWFGGSLSAAPRPNAFGDSGGNSGP